MGARSPVALERSLDRRDRAYRRRTAEFGERQLRRALRAAAPILRKDESPATQALASILRRDLRNFRAGRLPAGFTMLAPAGGPSLQSAPPLQPTEQPPGTPPPGTPPPGDTPAPTGSPDLVVDSLAGACFSNPFGDIGSCEIQATIRNAGSANAPASMTALAPNDTYQNETLVDTPALAAGEATVVRASCPMGTTRFSARADATGVVAEGDEANNNRAHVASADSDCNF